jgi:hypothetical protein
MPPLSLLGRVARRRPIIPGYDKVFVAPLLALLVAVPLGCVALAAAPILGGYGSETLLSAAVTLTWWILVGMGPGLEAWRLTGNCRIVRSRFQKDMVGTA